MSESITPEVIKALAELRKLTHSIEVQFAVAELDEAGIFAAIDGATGYDVGPEPEQTSKRTCPGDPAEMGDMAYKYPVRNDWDDAQDEQNRALDGYRNRRN